MSVIDSIVQEFEREMSVTRKFLERVPDNNFQWKPHEKSMTMGGLATHLANLPTWVPMTLLQDSFDVSPEGKPTPRAEEAGSSQALLDTFDRNWQEARESIRNTSEKSLQQPWSLLANGHEVFTMPRLNVLRSFVLHHSIHHRAQLGVYLRLQDLPVPSAYGPTADEE